MAQKQWTMRRRCVVRPCKSWVLQQMLRVTATWPVLATACSCRRATVTGDKRNAGCSVVTGFLVLPLLLLLLSRLFVLLASTTMMPLALALAVRPRLRHSGAAGCRRRLNHCAMWRTV